MDGVLIARMPHMLGHILTQTLQEMAADANARMGALGDGRG